MTFGSLFAGIGGFDLGFERAGLTCKWQVEINPYCRHVLAKHWPNVTRFEDVRDFAKDGNGGGLAVDVICGGFPCQDISNAGKRAGIDGEQSGLWSEYARIVRSLRPRFVVVENVAALLVRGIDRVLGDLAACGYDAEWDCLPAGAVGAPHRRDRLWIVAHSKCAQRWPSGAGGCDMDDDEMRVQGGREENTGRTGVGCEEVADRPGERCGPGRPGRFDSGGSQQHEQAFRQSREDGVPHAVFAGLEGHERGVVALAEFRRHNADPAGSGWWSVEPGLGRVANGIPNRVDRLKGLGNAVVPQVAEWIGRRLMSIGNG